jgi:hypothetical protein
MILNIPNRELIEGDVTVLLTPKEVQVLHALSRGGYVPTQRLVFVVYGDGDAVNAELNVQIVICRLRKKLNAIGWTGLIISDYGRYTLSRTIKAVTPVDPIVIPGVFRGTLETLLYSHPNRAAADRVLASFVGH